MVPPRRPVTRSRTGSTGLGERGRPRGGSMWWAGPRVENPVSQGVDPIKPPPGSMEARMANLERIVMMLMEERQAPPTTPQVAHSPPANGDASGKSGNRNSSKGKDSRSKMKRRSTCFRCGKRGHIAAHCDAIVLDRASGIVLAQASGSTVAATTTSSYPPGSDTGKEEVGGRVFATTLEQAEASPSTGAGNIAV